MVESKKASDYVFRILNTVFLSLLTLACLYPCLYVLFASFSDPVQLYTCLLYTSGKKINGFYQSVGGTAKVGDFWYQVSPEFQQWVLFNGDGNQSFLCICLLYTSSAF